MTIGPPSEPATCTCSAGLSRGVRYGTIVARYALEVLFNDVCDLWKWHACVVIDSKHLLFLDAFNMVPPHGIFETRPLPYRQWDVVLVAVEVIRVCELALHARQRR